MDGIRLVCIIVALCVHIFSIVAMRELKLVHVLFAHKLHAPREVSMEKDEASFPQTLSYEYFTSAVTDMSNVAKLNMYNLGVHLREIYDEFLGPIYTNEIIKMRTSEYPLSMLSAQLVNAGLWPPANDQMWMKGFDWQPIPTEYLEMKEDTLMMGSLCPNFHSRMDQVLRTNDTRKLLSRHRPLFDYLSHYTRRQIHTPLDVSLLYASLESMVDENKTLPHWALDVFPDGAMRNVTLLEYDLLSKTSLQRQLNGGTLLGEIISNSIKYVLGDMPKERKIMLYSGDERNIAGVLQNLNLWSAHIPNEGASLIFELYFNHDTATHEMKIDYYTGTDGTTISLLLPNCTTMCPLQTLLNVTFYSIPQNPQSLCGWNIGNCIQDKNNGSSTYNGSASRNRKNILFYLIVIYFVICILYDCVSNGNLV